MRVLKLLAVLGLTTVLSSPAIILAAAAKVNILQNVNLAKGAGNFPDHWQTEAWEQGPEYSTYQWIHQGAGNQLAVYNIKPNDARWMQSLTLSPGWYYFAADIKTTNVGNEATGASISIMEDGITSSDIRGTNDWRRVGFYLKVGKRGADVSLALRVGGYGSLNTGMGLFRNIEGERIDGPPPGAEPTFDLDAIRKQAEGAPIGSPWTLVATFILLGIIIALGWRTLGEQATSPPAEDAANQAQRTARR